MRKGSFAVRFAALMLSMIFIAACARPAHSAMKGTADALPQQTSAAAQPATPAGSPTPSGSIIPFSTVAAAPEDPDSYAREYYVVEQNGRKGVVDGRGRVVLPAAFSSVDIIQSFVYDAATQTSRYGDVAFFAVPAQVGANRRMGSAPGELYAMDGKKFTVGVVEYPYSYDGRTIQISKKDKAGYMQTGVLSFTGKVIIPCRYQELYAYQGGIAATRRAPPTSEGKISAVDIYSDDGKLLRSGLVEIKGANGSLLVVSDGNTGKLGLMNDRFQWVIEAEWDWVNSAGSDSYIVSAGGKYGLAGADGSLKLAVKYDGIEVCRSNDAPGQILIAASSAEGVFLFDTQGKTLFSSNQFRYLCYQDGILVATDSGNAMHALDVNGKELIPPAGYIFWNASVKLFECNYKDNQCFSYFTRDGVKLKLPEADAIQCISEDRFIITQTNQYGEASFGLCNAQGVIIAPVHYASMYTLDRSSLIVFSRREGKDKLRYGLMDMNGSIVLDAQYDALYGVYNKKLLYAHVGSIQGLIDTKGNWVWYTSVYDGLMD